MGPPAIVRFMEILHESQNIKLARTLRHGKDHAYHHQHPGDGHCSALDSSSACATSRRRTLQSFSQLEGQQKHLKPKSICLDGVVMAQTSTFSQKLQHELCNQHNAGVYQCQSTRRPYDRRRTASLWPMPLLEQM